VIHDSYMFLWTSGPRRAQEKHILAVTEHPTSSQKRFSRDHDSLSTYESAVAQHRRS